MIRRNRRIFARQVRIRSGGRKFHTGRNISWTFVRQIREIAHASMTELVPPTHEAGLDPLLVRSTTVVTAHRLALPPERCHGLSGELDLRVL